MTTSPAAAERPAAALTASTFLDIHHATVQAFTQDAVGDADTDREKARRLFACLLYTSPSPRDRG